MSRDGGVQAVRAANKILQIRTLLLKKSFSTIWWKAPFWLVENQKRKKDGNLGDPARGQADSGSAAMYTMDWPGPVICMYVCVGTVSHRHRPTDPPVVVYIYAYGPY
jgi:hypothetical protein